MAGASSRGDAVRAHVEACRVRGAKPEHDEELALAWHAAQGEAAAVRALDALVREEAAAAARRLDRAPGFADDVTQALRVRLLVGEDGPPRIGSYVGRGPLRGWIGVAALRVALNLRRATRPVHQEIFEELVGREEDPELRHLKTLYRAEFREALEATLCALAERPRALLRLSYVDGMSFTQLARLYGVHETTVGRWVHAAAAEVAEGTRRRLVERLAVSPASLDSIARMVLSQLDLSIGRVLRG